jgi:hypothetical protein
MAAVVEISDADRDGGCKNRIFGEVQLDACHQDTVPMWTRMLVA